MPPQQGVPHVLQLSGQDIVRVIVDAPQDETLLHEVCFRCGTGGGGADEEVTVKALHGGLVILETTAHGAPGQIVTVALDADAHHGDRGEWRRSGADRSVLLLRVAERDQRLGARAGFQGADVPAGHAPAVSVQPAADERGRVTGAGARPHPVRDFGRVDR